MTDDFDDQLAAEEAARSTIAETPTEPVAVETPEPETPSDTHPETEAPVAPADDPDESAMAERIKRAHIESREAKRRARELERELEVLKGTRTEPRDEAIDREARQLAGQIAAEELWNRECLRIGNAGMKEFGDFQTILNDFAVVFPEFRGVPRSLIEASIEAGDGHEHRIIHWLGKNLDEAERIANLPLTRQGAAVQRIADKLNQPKAVSKAPPPIRPAQGSSSETSAPVKDLDKMSMAEFVKYQDELDMKRRFRR